MYASLTSYADTGTIVYEWGTASVSRHSFKTAYRAPRHFIFEFTEDEADGGSRFVIWCEGSDFQSWDSDTRIHTVHPQGRGTLAFTAFIYPTVGSATQMASMLFQGTGLISTLSELGEVTLAGTETVNGRPAYKLTGIARGTYGTGHEHNVRRAAVWIDTETLLVRKIFEDTPDGVPAGTRLRKTTMFNAQANPPLDDSRFRFIVPAARK